MWTCKLKNHIKGAIITTAFTIFIASIGWFYNSLMALKEPYEVKLAKLNNKVESIKHESLFISDAIEMLNKSKKRTSIIRQINFSPEQEKFYIKSFKILNQLANNSKIAIASDYEILARYRLDKMRISHYLYSSIQSVLSQETQLWNSLLQLIKTRSDIDFDNFTNETIKMITELSKYQGASEATLKAANEVKNIEGAIASDEISKIDNKINTLKISAIALIFSSLIIFSITSLLLSHKYDHKA